MNRFSLPPVPLMQMSPSGPIVVTSITTPCTGSFSILGINRVNFAR